VVGEDSYIHGNIKLVYFKDIRQSVNRNIFATSGYRLHTEGEKSQQFIHLMPSALGE
jgi:hypothetical protein